MNNIALTISNSDLGTAHSIQDDLKIFAQHNVESAAVITSFTNNGELLHTLNETVISLQMTAIFQNFSPKCIKISGMSSQNELYALLKVLENYELPFLIYDPNFLNKTSYQSLNVLDLYTLKHEFMQTVSLLTVNIAEAELLCGRKIFTPQDMEQAATILHQLGCGAVLIKGGQMLGSSDDYFFNNTHHFWLRSSRLPTIKSHLGSILNAAITAKLTAGDDLVSSLAGAKNYLNSVLKNKSDI